MLYPALAGHIPSNAVKRVVGFLAVDFALGFAVPDDFGEFHGDSFRFGDILCGICAVNTIFSLSRGRIGALSRT